MKIAVLSDIHGNLAALDAVLRDAAARDVDEIVNLGDILSGGLFPRETADRLIPLGLPTIRGNHERQLLDCAPETLGASDRYAAACLGPDHRAWIASLSATLRLNPEVLMVHGTPDCDLTYFLDTVTPEGLRPASDAELQERAGNRDVSVILCGHTHLPGIRMLEDGRLIVNPGSVGLPAYADDKPFPHVVETGSPHARYAVLTKAQGLWSAELCKVAYDWEQAARDAEAHGRSDWARALRTGLV